LKTGSQSLYQMLGIFFATILLTNKYQKRYSRDKR
jgi:hypothetical protein